MAVVTFNRKDFETLLGKELTDKEYMEAIPMMGTPLEEMREEEVDIEVFPNRPDLYSVEGFARAAQGFFGLQKGLVNYDVKPSNYSVNMEKKATAIRPCAAFAVIKNLRFDDETVASFMQLQDKLSITIGRRRKKCSMGTYDIDAIEFPIRYATKGLDYKFIPLGFSEEMTIRETLKKHPRCIEYAHLLKDLKEYPLYIDAKERAMCLLPYTNAEFAKVNPDTKNIFLEVTGNEWKAVIEMLNVFTASCAERGAKIYQVTANFQEKTPYGKSFKAPSLKPWKMPLKADYINRILDLDLKRNEFKKELEKMRFGFDGKNVLVPAYRTDIMHPIDIAEDVAIGHGYEKFEPRIPKIATIGLPNATIERRNELRNIMIGLGFQEVTTFVLSNKNREFTMMNKPEKAVAEIQNPKTEEYTTMRSALAPGLLGVFSNNASSEMPQRIFEVGEVVELDKSCETGAVNRERIAAGVLHSDASYSEMRASVDAFFRCLGKKFELKESGDSTFIPGRAADIISGKKVGTFGEVSPQVLANFGITYPVALFEFDVGKI